MNQTQIIALPGQPALTIIREFEAPRELVFKAHVDPVLYAQWLGPRSHTMQMDVFEPRDGGRYRYHTEAEGQEVGFSGVFHEVTAPERIISTWEFEGLPERGHIELTRLLFEDLPGGRSRLTSYSIYFSVEDRDGAMQSGMEVGVVEGYERLDEVLVELREKA
jgi:uncharacterized protein YndB with AHSA1/START domain